MRQEPPPRKSLRMNSKRNNFADAASAVSAERYNLSALTQRTLQPVFWNCLCNACAVPAVRPAHFPNRSNTLRVIWITLGSPPRRPCDQSVLPQVKTVPPFPLV